MGRSTSYIIGFATVVCLICAVMVASSVVALKPQQEANKVLDKQRKVLAVAGVLAEDAKATPDETRKLFAEKIRPKIVDLATGEYVTDVKADTFDQRAEENSQPAPANNAGLTRVPKRVLVYHVMNGETVEKLILPIEGKGLWSTLYGFLALEKDGNTVAGIIFYQHGETPGLGGEIDNPRWKALWPGRKAFDESGKARLEIIKGAAPPPAEAPHKVDGLSGATLTGRGVTHLVQFWLGQEGFAKYLENFKKSVGNPS